MNSKKTYSRLLMKSRLMTRLGGKSSTVVTSKKQRGCPGCGKKKTEQNLNEIFGNHSRG